MANVVKIVVDAVDKTKKGLTTPIKSVKDLRAAVDNLKPAFKAAALAGTAAFAAFVKSSTSAAIEMTRIRNAMFAATGSAEGVAKGMDDVREISDRLGLSLVDTARGYSKLSAASKGTALEGEKAVDILEGVATAASALSLSADDTAGALKAVEQIISKGTVQAEELRGQLGERVPGAFQIASRAMGVTTQELGKMLERGEVLSDDFLPKFAAELKRTFGDAADVASQSIVGNMNRMENAMFEVRNAVGQDLIPVFNELLKSFTQSEKGISGIKDATDGLRGVFRALIREGLLVAKTLDSIAAISQGVGITWENMKLQTKFAVGAIDGGEYMKQLKVLEQGARDTEKSLAQIGAEMEKIFDPNFFDNQPLPSPKSKAPDAAGSSGDLIPGVGDPVKLNDKAKSFFDGIERQHLKLHASKAKILSEEVGAQMTQAMELIDDAKKRDEALVMLAEIYSAKRQEIRDEDLAREAEANEFIKALNEQAQLGQLDWMAQERQIAEDDHQRNLERILEIGASEAKQREMQQAAEAAHQARLVKIQEDADRQKIQLRLRVYDAWADAFGAMANVSAAFFGRESAAAKAFAITEAIINTYRAANQVLADPSLPFFLKIPAMITTIGTGLANVASISGVAHGGIAEVPSDQTFLLKKGERVLSPDQNSDFVDFMEGGGGGASNIELTINLDGDPLWRGLAKASRDGRATISARAIV